MIDINEIEDFLWKFFGEQHAVAPAGVAVVTVDACPSCRLTRRTFTEQDLGPALADFLHERGVDVDWTDRSRYGEKETQK